MTNKYILDAGGEPVAESDLKAWAAWFGSAERRVAKEVIGDSTISTVFLGLDHTHGCGTPVLWETMVFGGPLDEEQVRCGGGGADAKAMHAAVVELVRNASTTPVQP